MGDLLPLDMARQDWLVQQIRQVFTRWGYHGILTPTLEPIASFTAEGTVEPEAVLQVRDRQGVLLGLRPELTASIARLAMTRLADSPRPQRLCYVASVYRNLQRAQEFLQGGVELIGAGGWLADAEVLLIIADCMRALGLRDWSLIIGDVGISQALLSGLTPSVQPLVRQAIRDLDRVGLETAKLSDRDRQLALQMLDLRGEPATILSTLSQFSLPPQQQARLLDLKSLAAVLAEHAIPVILDLSLWPTFAYYSGIVFEVTAAATAIGQGGRYDHLLHLYNPTHPEPTGIGFSLNLDQIERLLPIPAQPTPSDRLVVPTTPAAISASLALAQQWRQEGLRVELELSQTSPEQITSPTALAIAWVQSDGSYHLTQPQ